MRKDKPYFSDYWLPIQTPNGIWWMLKGRLLYLRTGSRHQFCIRIRGHHSHEWYFGFGSRA